MVFILPVVALFVGACAAARAVNSAAEVKKIHRLTSSKPTNDTLKAQGNYNYGTRPMVILDSELDQLDRCPGSPKCMEIIAMAEDRAKVLEPALIATGEATQCDHCHVVSAAQEIKAA